MASILENCSLSLISHYYTENSEHIEIICFNLKHPTERTRVKTENKSIKDIDIALLTKPSTVIQEMLRTPEMSFVRIFHSILEIIRCRR